jgi:uncharacterized protein YndB with AHSA1/START domain
MSDSTPVQTTEQEITITRVFDAPRELVVNAWTDPDQVAKWFGPAGFETPRDSVEIDMRVGGRLNLRMIKPGTDTEYRLRYEIIKVVESELLVLKSEPMPEVGLHHDTIARIELEEADGKTRMTLTDGPYTGEGGQGAGAGWKASFDKLETLLVATPYRRT